MTTENTYYLQDRDQEPRQLTQSEVDDIFRSSATEHQGAAVHGIAEIIIQETPDGERTLWAYRIGNTWTTVPKAFESMTYYWEED